MRRLLSIPLLLCACGGTVDRGVPDAGGRTFGRLAVVLTLTADGGTQIATVGRLLRYRHLDVDSAQILAGGVAAEPPAGRCVLANDEALLEGALAAAPADSAVQLLDAGDLSVRVAGRTLRMAPNWVPEILPFVSGVTYQASADSDPLGPGSDLREEALVTGFGGADVGHFATQAEVPPPPRIIGFAASSDGVEVSWQTAPQHGGVTVVVARTGGPSLRCSVPDSGKAVFTPDDVSAVLAGTDPVTVSVERTARTPFSAPGLQAGAVSVTVRDTASLRQ